MTVKRAAKRATSGFLIGSILFRSGVECCNKLKHLHDNPGGAAVQPSGKKRNQKWIEPVPRTFVRGDGLGAGAAETPRQCVISTWKLANFQPRLETSGRPWLL